MRLKAWMTRFSALLVAWLVVSLLMSQLIFRLEPNGDGDDPAWAETWGIHKKEILIMYLFAASDPEFFDNLRFFVSEMTSNTADQECCDYVIIVQDYKGDGAEVRAICCRRHL